MAEIGITVSHAVEQPKPRQTNAEEASLLGTQKASLITRIRRTYYSGQGRPVEKADILVPARLCEIVYEIPTSGQWDGCPQPEVGALPAHQYGTPNRDS